MALAQTDHTIDEVGVFLGDLQKLAPGDHGGVRLAVASQDFNAAVSLFLTEAGHARGEALLKRWEEGDEPLRKALAAQFMNRARAILNPGGARAVAGAAIDKWAILRTKLKSVAQASGRVAGNAAVVGIAGVGAAPILAGRAVVNATGALGEMAGRKIGAALPSTRRVAEEARVAAEHAKTGQIARDVAEHGPSAGFGKGMRAHLAGRHAAEDATRARINEVGATGRRVGQVAGIVGASGAAAAATASVAAGDKHKHKGKGAGGGQFTS